MNKREIYDLLSARNIRQQVTVTKAVYKMTEVADIHLTPQEVLYGPNWIHPKRAGP